MNKILVVLASLSMSAVGCAADASDPSQTTAAAPTAEGQQAMRTQTIVRFASDGTKTVERHAVELAPSATASEGHVAMNLEVAKDNACAGSSLWMWDGAKEVGNELCVFGPGQIELSTFCRVQVRIPLLNGGSVLICRANWSQAVRSIYAGVDYGWFTHNDVDMPCTEWFNPWQYEGSVSACIANSDAVGILPPIQ
ncbi:MAG: hypothetical protein ACHREM_19595 [Polyangiales bacterium]